MKRRWVLVTILVIAGLVVWGVASGGGSKAPRPPRAFCVAAYNYERELERTAKRGHKDLGRQIELVTAMDDAAPRAIRAETHKFLRALQQLQDDPTIHRDRASDQAAVDAVNRYASQGCRLFEQQPEQ